jgi:hypothetical protein
MATKREVMLAGTSAKLAHMLASDAPMVVVPGGFDQASATLLQTNFVVLAGGGAAKSVWDNGATTWDAGQTVWDAGGGGGVRLRPASGQYIYFLFNANSDTIEVYPDGDEFINDLASAAPFVLEGQVAGLFVPSSRQWIAATGLSGGTISGTISGVLAGVGLTGGGNSGTVTLALASPVQVVNGGTGAGTVDAALANLGGAPLASPQLTGVPTAPTAAPGTNTIQLATTAFVLSEAVGAGGVTVTTASYTLSVMNIERIYVSFNGAATITLNPAMMFNGQEIVIMDTSGFCSAANAITVLPGGSAHINGQSSALINTAYGRLRLIYNGTNYVVS